jgi:hypothetical protein
MRVALQAIQHPEAHKEQRRNVEVPENRGASNRHISARYAIS